MSTLISSEETDAARIMLRLRRNLSQWQACFTAIEKCPVPVIAAVNGACIGAGIDLISACDIRYCTQDARFSVKEVDVALAADLGTLQRLPKIVGYGSFVRELCFTGKNFNAEDAFRIGLVSYVAQDRKDLMDKTLALARTIASKSPVAVFATKAQLVFSRDHSVQEGLDSIAAWNGALLQSEDLMKAAESIFTKKPPKFAKL